MDRHGTEISMKPEFKHLGLTTMPAVGRHFWPLVALAPLIGYAVDSWRGGLLGLAFGLGTLLAVPLLVIVFDARFGLYQRRWQRRRARCPGCMAVVEGRCACPHCRAELAPLLYLWPSLTRRECPHCQGKLDEIRVGCMRDACGNSVCRTDVRPFDRLPGIGILAIVGERSFRSPFIGEAAKAGSPPAGLRATTVVGTKAAAKIFWALDVHYTMPILSEQERRSLELIWVEPGVLHTAIENVSDDADQFGDPQMLMECTPSELVEWVSQRCGWQMRGEPSEGKEGKRIEV